MSYLKSASSNVSDCKISQKNPKMSKFGTENVLFGYFGPDFSKNYCHIRNQPASNLSNMRILPKKKEMSKFGTKNTLFGSFWARIFKIFCHIWNQHPRICLNTTFCKKAKKAKSKTKNALFGYFLARIWKKLLSYLRSALSSFSKMSL